MVMVIEMDMVMMFHELIEFAIKHWALVSAFVIVFILLMIEESWSQSGDGFQLSPISATQLINHENAVVIDLRDANAFRDAHIIGAKNVSSSELAQDLKKLDDYRDMPIILVDAAGSSAASLSSRLKKANFQKVNLLKGGMSAWKTAGMPVVSEYKPKKSRK